MTLASAVKSIESGELSALELTKAILDRIDSLCFAGPVFFHLCRYYF